MGMMEGCVELWEEEKEDLLGNTYTSGLILKPNQNSVEKIKLHV